jgi:hypothetical protein
MANAIYGTAEIDIVANWQGGGFGFETGDKFPVGYLGLAQYLNGSYKYSDPVPYEVGKLLSLSGQLINDDTDGCALAVYVDGVGLVNPVSSTKCSVGATNTVWAIGANPIGTSVNGGFQQNSSIYSVRLYDRALSIEEIQQNAALDQIRYLDVPVVTIGGNPCTNVAIVSSTLINCTAPAGTAGPQDVVVTNSDGSNPQILSGAYTYVDGVQYTTVSSLSPNYLQASGGENLVVTGTKLDQVSSVTIDGVECAITAQAAASLTCTTPAELNYQSGNVKQFVITAVGNTIAGSIEYREFLSLSGISSTVALSSSNRTSDQTMTVSTNSQLGYNVTVQTENPGRDTGHESDLMCEQSGQKNYLAALSTETAVLPAATYSLKPNSGNYLPLSINPTKLFESNLPSLNPATPDSLSMTIGVNTDLPAVACPAYTGVLRYTAVANF